MKEKLTLSIEVETLNIVKENIPNISEFVEECFKSYLMIAGMNDEVRGEELRKAWETFRESQLRIHMLTGINYEKQSIEKLQEKVKTDAWLTVWSDYRRTGSTQDFKIEEACKTLDITTKELKKVLNETYAESRKDMKNMYIFDNWTYIEENILPTIKFYKDDDEEFDLDDLLNGKVDLD